MEQRKKQNRAATVPPSHNSTGAYVEGLYVIEGLRSARRSRRNKDALEFLVKWKDYPESVNTWEPEREILRTVPLLASQMAQRAQGHGGNFDGPTRAIFAARGWASLSEEAELATTSGTQTQRITTSTSKRCRPEGDTQRIDAQLKVPSRELGLSGHQRNKGCGDEGHKWINAVKCQSSIIR